MENSPKTERTEATEINRTVALVGNPNSGKTTLFNVLTGMRQKVGNYPGVTVEKKEGIAYTQHGKKIKIIDLPGSYSLNARSPDEQILVDVLLGRIAGTQIPDQVICCLDSSNLERNLFMATQVLELGLPTLLVLNMTDVAERRGIRVDARKLSDKLGVPVIPVQGNRGKGLLELKVALSQELKLPKIGIRYPELVNEAVADLAKISKRAHKKPESFKRGEATLLLTGEQIPISVQAESTRIGIWKQRLDRSLPGWQSHLISLRYDWISELMRDCVRKFNPNKVNMTERIDKVLLHPLMGFVALGMVLTFLFYSIFSLATPFMDGIDYFVGWVGEVVDQTLPEGAIKDLVVEGIIGGVGGVVIFLPQILMLFFFISVLEASGYMARAAFILDRLMSKVGLHGRSFIPLLSSYACAVPGIMATRTIESPKDRLVTILVAPFMACSARLPVYLVMIAALLPEGEGHALKKAGMLLFLYFLGTAGALVFAFLFKKILFRGEKHSMVMELPAYRIPQPFSVFREMLDRAWIFIRRAGTVIFSLSIILWFLMSYPKIDQAQEILDADQKIEQVEKLNPIEYSFAGKMGQFTEPAFEPLGYDWRITIGLVASFAAREVFVSTMAIIYRVDEDEESSLVSTLREAKRDDGSRLFTPLTCLSILIFFVFALQCISTVAIVKRETRSWNWAIFQFAYMFAVAWVTSFFVYQGGLLLGFQ